jgi:hypothetical protein
VASSTTLRLQCCIPCRKSTLQLTERDETRKNCHKCDSHHSSKMCTKDADVCGQTGQDDCRRRAECQNVAASNQTFAVLRLRERSPSNWHRTIYGFPALEKYALGVQKPIRKRRRSHLPATRSRQPREPCIAATPSFLIADIAVGPNDLHSAHRAGGQPSSGSTYDLAIMRKST